jgi:hypothetical protein
MFQVRFSHASRPHRIDELWSWVVVLAQRKTKLSESIKLNIYAAYTEC